MPGHHHYQQYDEDEHHQQRHHFHHHHHEHPRLKERDIKIAICTSDSREGTIEFLERMGLESMVDIIVCGDDEVSNMNAMNDFASSEAFIAPGVKVEAGPAQRGVHLLPVGGQLQRCHHGQNHHSIDLDC